MSSRNQYLTTAERAIAPLIHQQLQQARRGLLDGASESEVERVGQAALAAAGFRTDYFTVRDATDLQPARPDARERVVLVAAPAGRARLIDNLRLS